MNGIQVVLYLVRCSQSLLLCEDLPSDHLRFSSMDVCQAEIASVTRETKLGSARGAVVMAKCRYLLIEPDKSPSAGERDPMIAQEKELERHAKAR
ncbi:MAG: hypothetical protein AAF495_23085 [Pseudomonadota bacterium]